MRIGELAAATGVEPETIRYYEREALLAPPQRQANGYRVYGQAHLERLSFIRHCRALDIPLADIRRLMDFLDAPGADCGDIDQLIETQLTRVRVRLQSMQALEQQLSELRKRCDARHATGDCGILHELVAAAHGEGCVCHGKPVEPDWGK
jgi:Cd(II)/Pb(II)-responsive transcriptional regulator